MSEGYRMCNCNLQNYDKVVLYFMSDGVWTYPDKAIANFNANPGLMKKVDFQAVGFSSGSA